MENTISKVASSNGSVGTGKRETGNGKQIGSRGKSKGLAPTLARELVWLDDIRRGYSIKEIARREGVGCRRIQYGVSRAREHGSLCCTSPGDSRHDQYGRNEQGTGTVEKARRDDPNRPPRLVPLFPVGPFTPQSACPHHGTIRSGSMFCCMVCSQSGIDDHPALKRDPRTDPRPERKAAVFVRSGGAGETRKQRRRQLNLARQPVSDINLEHAMVRKARFGGGERSA